MIKALMAIGNRRKSLNCKKQRHGQAVGTDIDKHFGK